MAKHLMAIDRALTDATATGNARIILSVPPRHGKSQLVSRFFPAWRLGVMPDRKIILCSYEAEFAASWGRSARGLLAEHGHLFGVSVSKSSSAADRWDIEGREGGMITAGVGGAITGRGGDVIIDDPTKNYEEAHSETYREKTWDWFTSCFVAGTPVLMANGEWKAIETVHPGEKVVSFDGSGLVTNCVRATGKQPVDAIYRVKTEYGVVECTGEHPFFRLPIKRTGRWMAISRGEWVKARDLKKDDRVLMSLAGAKSGCSRRSRFPGTRKFVPKDFWWLLGFIYGDGFLRSHGFAIALGDDEKLNKRVMDLCSRFFGKVALYKRGREHSARVYSLEAKKVLEHFGMKHGKAGGKEVPQCIFKQPLTHRQAFLSGLFSADAHRTGKKTFQFASVSKRLVEGVRLLAISSGYLCGKIGESKITAKPPGSKLPVQSIAYRLHARLKRVGFYPARIQSLEQVGMAETYNLEVENTEAFIANGFVVHNTAYTRIEPNCSCWVIMTRWHEDDLAGRIVERLTHENWKVIKFPALATEYDTLGRKPGEALWPERFNEERLDIIRKTLGSYQFSSLYQQSPTPAEGGMFKREWLAKFVDAVPANAKRVRFWDKAATEGGGDPSAGVLMAAADDGLFYVEDVVLGQWSSGARNRIIYQTAELDETRCGKRNYQVWVEREGGSGGKESAEISVRELAGFDVHADLVTGSKESRARPFAAQCEAGNVRIVRGEWNRRYIDELCAFPAGTHDDQVDASSGAFNKLILCKRKMARVW